MAIDDQKPQLQALNEQIAAANAEAQRLTSASLTATGAWMEAQTAANLAYGDVVRLQTELGRSLHQLHQARVTLTALVDAVTTEGMRRSMQA